MSLAEIKDFVDMTKQGDATLESRLAVFRNQRDVVKRQIAELRRRYIKLDVVITSGASCTKPYFEMRYFAPKPHFEMRHSAHTRQKMLLP